jgi:hypothetical protein
VRKVMKAFGWHQLAVWRPGQLEPAEEARRAAERAERERVERQHQRRLAEERAAIERRKQHVREVRARRLAREEERRLRRASKPVWEDTTTDESDSGGDVDEDEMREVAEEDERIAQAQALLADSVASFDMQEGSVDSAAGAGAGAGGGGRGKPGAGRLLGAGGVLGGVSGNGDDSMIAPSAEISRKDVEVVTRRGRWMYGKFTEWVSATPSRSLTYEFVRRFFRDGVEFDSLYASMLARRLPQLPDGVDPNDLWVRDVVQPAACRGVRASTVTSASHSLAFFVPPLFHTRFFCVGVAVLRFCVLVRHARLPVLHNAPMRRPVHPRPSLFLCVSFLTANPCYLLCRYSCCTRRRRWSLPLTLVPFNATGATRGSRDRPSCGWSARPRHTAGAGA